MRRPVHLRGPPLNTARAVPAAPREAHRLDARLEAALAVPPAVRADAAALGIAAIEFAVASTSSSELPNGRMVKSTFFETSVSKLGRLPPPSIISHPFRLLSLDFGKVTCGQQVLHFCDERFACKRLLNGRDISLGSNRPRA